MFQLGAAWYPEHWPEERWATDLQLMKDANFTVVRVAEFAWSSMEPEEGEFKFKWLDKAIKLASEYDLKTVICTPSATPPAWLTQKYPETLRWDLDGKPTFHGHRRHYNPNSEKYIKFCNRITKKMAKRYADNPNVIGWQTDNEFSTMSYDPITRKAFQDWLKDKYGSLDALNEDWCTAYWSQTYSDWSQIDLGYPQQSANLKINFRRFFSDAYAKFQKEQIDIIRKYVSANKQWITHNFCPFYEFDREVLVKDLDFCSWDAYMTSKGLDTAVNGFDVDLIRGLQRKNIWIMETQPGFVNWKAPNLCLSEGGTRAVAWHMVGHGADAILYWQWRAALGGQEVYHGTILGPDGGPRPVYDEIKQLGADFKKVNDTLFGSEPKAKVAMIHDMGSQWAIDADDFHPDFKHLDHMAHWYRQLRAANVTVDVITPNADLSGYDFVAAPHLHMIDQPVADRIKKFVEDGGHVLLGPRSGFRDFNQRVWAERQPALLTETLGASVREFYSVEPACSVSSENIGDGECRIWGEWLEVGADDVDVLLTYGKPHGWLEGKSALVRREVGKGSIAYLGCWLEDEYMGKLMNDMLMRANVKPEFSATPEDIEVCLRVKDQQVFYIVMNHAKASQVVTLPKPMQDLLKGEKHSADITLEPNEVVVLTA